EHAAGRRAARPATPGVPMSVSLQPAGNPAPGLTTSVTVVEWVKLGLELVPVIVRVKALVGVEADVETLNVEEPEPPLIEVGLKVPDAPLGNPLRPRSSALQTPWSGLTF